MSDPTDDEVLRVVFSAIALWQVMPLTLRDTDPTILAKLPAIAVTLADEVVKELNKLKEPKS